MKKLKSFGVALIVMILMVCVVIPTTASAANGYGFRSQSVTIKPGDSASKFIKANKKYLVGKPKNAKTCIASSGYDVTRTYKYFKITTYASKKNGEGKLESLTITSSKVTTPQKIKIGTKESDIKKKIKNVRKLGKVYISDLGKTRISIKVKNSKVSSIEYLYTGNF